MAETLVKNTVCNACGSEARPHALYCYHCGGSLQVEEVSNNNNDEPSDVWFRGDISDDAKNSEIIEEKDIVQEQSKKSEEAKEEDIESKSKFDEEIEPKQSEEEIDKDYTPKVKVKSKSLEEESENEFPKDSKLKSAAALRDRKKPERLKKVEIVWEEHENSPNILFVLFALLLTVLVAVMIFIAFYLK